MPVMKIIKRMGKLVALTIWDDHDHADEVGTYMLTPTEARELAAELNRAADAAEKGGGA